MTAELMGVLMSAAIAKNFCVCDMLAYSPIGAKGRQEREVGSIRKDLDSLLNLSFAEAAGNLHLFIRPRLRTGKWTI